MSETLQIQGHTQAERYHSLLPQLASLLEGETDWVAATANTAAALREAFGWFWIGFYVVKSGAQGEELVLGPFQGPIACTRIKKGRGVCGTAWAEAKTIVVPDVEKFPGHIACSSLSKSEIVVPVFSAKTKQVAGILDVDSDTLESFDAVDAEMLTRVCALLSPLF